MYSTYHIKSRACRQS